MGASCACRWIFSAGRGGRMERGNGRGSIEKECAFWECEMGFGRFDGGQSSVKLEKGFVRR